MPWLAGNVNNVRNVQLASGRQHVKFSYCAFLNDVLPQIHWQAELFTENCGIFVVFCKLHI